MIDFYPITSLSSKEIDETAATISAYTAASQQGLVALTHEEIQQSDQAFVAFASGLLAGYIRAKPPQHHEQTGYIYQEVGSLVVAKEFRRRGIARALIGLVTDEVIFQDHIPCALANFQSQPLFETMGYEPSLAGELPAAIASQLGNTGLVYPRHKIVDMN